jgi:hypothetical protein
MPIVPFDAVTLARGQTMLAKPQSLDNPQAPSNASTLDVAAAALRQNNVASNAPQLISDAVASFDDVYDPHFDPLSDEQLAGYEPFAARFIASNSEAESQRIKNRINTELADRKVIQEAGGAGLAASVSAGLLDPITLASMAVPLLGTGTRAMRILKGVGASMALDSGQELVLHAEQSLRTLGDSAINIGAGALLTGSLGGIATRMTKEEFKAAEEAGRALDRATAPNFDVESTGGAARVGFGTTLEDETVAKGGEALLKSLGKINPLARVMNSMSKRARILMQEIADVPFLLNKHLKGIATPVSAEGEILAEQAVRYDLIKKTDAAWAEHKAAGGSLSRGRFAEEVAFALRRGDVSADPAVQKLLTPYRKYFTDSLKKLKAAGLVAEDASVQFATSYLPRLYDHVKIKSNRIALEDALTDWFSRSGDVDKAEIKSAVTDVVETLRGAYRDHAQIQPGFVGKSGSLLGRTLSVPDEVLEPWLVNDVEKVMESYIRSTTPQLVLKKKFGDIDMKQQMQDVSDEFDAMRERAKTNESKAHIDSQKDATLRDLQAVRDMLLGKFAKPADPDSILTRTGRVFRAWNYVRLLGGQVLSSLPDAGRIVARHGLIKTAAKVARLVSDSGLRNMTKDEAHRIGTALEYVLNTRADTLADIGDEFASSKLDRVLRRESNRFSRLTGMASWNSALKTLAVGLEQDAIVRAAKGGAMSKFQKGTLAQLGIGDRMAQRISKELDTHAAQTEGLFRANAEKWTDKEAAAAYEGALLKSADQVVLTKGVGDVPLFMSKEIGKTLLQFKSFGMAAVNRQLIPMAQGLAHGDLATLNGAWMMMALGALANAARDTASGYKPSTDPTRIAIEAFDRAGFTTFLSEPLDILSGTLGGPRFGRFTSQSVTETLGGPTFGTGEDIRKTLQGAFTDKGQFSPSLKADDIYRFRKLLPYQNLFYLRRIVNMLEGEFSEAIGAEGAGAKGAGERLTEMKDLNRG